MSDAQRADAVYEKLLERAGERWVQPRKERTARILTLLDDPQRTYRVVHITGTNGKTSTARMIESLLRAHGLRTGLFTSPHLKRFTERIMIDGEPVADAAVADAWDEIEPFVGIVDAELEASGDASLTFFELLTVLAFVAAADAPVDVLVLEVGMGGSWDSTNTADGDVAVFAPIDMDHADRLGATIEAIAEVKSGIIKDGAAVVSAEQKPEVAEVLRKTAAEKGATIAFEGVEFGLSEQKLAVGGQMISVRGLAAEYADEYLPLYGAHQGHNAALAVAAVESLIGGAERRIAGDILTEGLQNATSPGRLRWSASRRPWWSMPRTTRMEHRLSPALWMTASTSTNGVWCWASSPTRMPTASSTGCCRRSPRCSPRPPTRCGRRMPMRSQTWSRPAADAPACTRPWPTRSMPPGSGRRAPTAGPS
ncbi:hypothetical protein GCM10025863_05810 [Microbacterium suwonense]|uniref:Mur ligase central domain-containing protein n=1 Tax=Microbacterium suwonense TaxID=683047 RepID=A0ABN6X0L0_9MICO|nr:hypothetical protein GCM10025863_05810 [Microbacterium suwonense]